MFSVILYTYQKSSKPATFREIIQRAQISLGEPETSLGWRLVLRLVLSALHLKKALSATQSMLQELLDKAEGCEGWDLIWVNQ